MLTLLCCTSIHQKATRLVRNYYALTRTFHFSSSARKHAEPISFDEFQEHLQECLDPREREDSIAVAFSGGPDSTCLLYLLNRLASSNTALGWNPKKIIAVTIDHDLQASSRQMTEKCIAIADLLKVRHIVLKIPWGEAPFPSVPSKGSFFENMARKARYHLLLSAMKRESISTIAFGHHADDQVETALLRLSRGSTEAGVAGMSTHRLWGMGFGFGPNDLGWAGQHGMNRWIIRPLLRFPKERLIATCREARLEYVVDKTNFKPDVALRNRIRLQLGGASAEGLAQGTKALIDMAARHTVSGHSWPGTYGFLHGNYPASLAQLRAAVESVSLFREKTSCEASIQLTKCLRPSPVSTIFLSKDEFSRVTDNSVRLEVIRRILRFVSPYPWGSPRAEAGRRSASLLRISDTLTKSRECLSPGGDMQTGVPPRKFTAGGGVLWTPVRITRNAEMKFSVEGISIGDEVGWLASRQPPIQRFRETAGKSLELDITPMITSSLSQDCSVAVEVLYDCRFLLHIRPRLFPSDAFETLRQLSAESGEASIEQASVKLVVIPHTRYFLPKVVLRRTDAPSKSLSSGNDYQSQGQASRREDDHEIARLLPDGSTRTRSSNGENNKDGKWPDCSGEAVRIKCIRILDTAFTNNLLDRHSM